MNLLLLLHDRCCVHAGQRQLLGFARLFAHHRHSAVRLALLDEASSSISGAAEALLYGLCRRLGVAVLSVGHR